MEKKLKWPKFLTVKRTILLALLVLVITILLVYFLGGYKASAYESDLRDFSTKDFITYEKLLDEKLVVVDDENKAYKESLSNLTAENIATEIDNYIQAIKCKTNKDDLSSRILALRTALGTSYSTYYSKVSSLEIITDVQYAKELLGVFELLFSNNNYAFYFNNRYTSFRIDSIENGDVNKVINSWYSNPQLEGNDVNSANPTETAKTHASPIIVNFMTKAGAIKYYNAYDYAISDIYDSGVDKEEVTPTFQIKPDYQNKSIQVYYELFKKGTSYADFPQYLSVTRIADLIERNTQYISEQLELLKSYYDEENDDALFSYVNKHKNNPIIMDYTKASNKSLIGIEAYNNYMFLTDRTDKAYESNYNQKIEELCVDFDELYGLACEMLRTEYQFNYKVGNGFYMRDEVQLKMEYSEVTKEITTDEEGNEVDNSYRGFPSYKTMKSTSRKVLSQILFTRLQYTTDDLTLDLAEHDVENTSTNATFKVCIEYQLTEKGLTTTILNNSIYESHKDVYPLYRIDVLPYFTSEIYQVEHDGNNYATSGDMVIPDGSGALIELNNGKTNYTQYSKRIYSTDLAFGNEIKQSETVDVLLPMLAITSDRLYDVNTNQVFKNSSAIIARVDKGAAQASISANVSLFNDSFNKAYFSFTYRESQLVTIGTGYYAKEISKFTEDFVKTDAVIDYYVYSSNEKDYTYSDVAREYQKILVEKGILNNEHKDTTDSTVINAEVLGMYDYTTNFLGIVYSGFDTLTTYEQTEEIIKALKAWNAKEINLLFKSWRDGGLINETFKDMSFANKLGSKKEYKALLSFLEESNITMYPVTSFLEINKYSDSFGKTRYSTRDVSSEYTEKYPYDLAGNMYDKTKRAYYILSPKFYSKFAEILASNFNKKNPDLHAMAFEKLGASMVGDYEKREVLYRNESVLAQIDAFEVMAKDNRITDISLNSPYEFAAKYANNITELPYEATLYEIFNYSIPLYQLVFSGYKDYSGLVINANDEISLTKHLMNILSTGSNVQFTFTYDNSSELIQTDYNHYYYTQYSQWQTEVQEILNVLDGYEIHKYALTNHEVYEGYNSVYKVTYTNKYDANDSFNVYLNYSEKIVPITIANGTTQNLASWNYYVDKEVNN